LKRSEHCKRDEELFGKSFPHIHKELDRFFPTHNILHRRLTHHVEYVRMRFESGDWNHDECISALMHIIDDCGKVMSATDWLTPQEMFEGKWPVDMAKTLSHLPFPG